MPRGRPPSPDAINYLKGDPGKRRRYQSTPHAATVAPPAPDYLDDVAKAKWHELVALLLDMGVLAKVDGTALVMCCEAWSRYRQASDAVIQYGVISPHYKVLAKAIVDNWTIVNKCLIEFGCTPAARARMKVQPREEAKKSKWSGVLKIKRAN